MSRIVKYLLVSVWGLVMPCFFYAQNASMGAADSYDRLEASFQGNSFSRMQLETFEERGKQKIKDFLDLAFFLQSKDLEESLRKHVEDQLRDLFVSGERAMLEFNSLDEFLNTQSFPYQKKESIEIEISSPFESGENGYRAKASFSLPKSSGEIEKLTAQLLLQKQLKKFGEESIELWEVLIGEIKREH